MTKTIYKCKKHGDIESYELVNFGKTAARDLCKYCLEEHFNQFKCEVVEKKDSKTYNFDSEQHAAKIKAGMKAAKQAGKKLGRPKGGKIKGEDEVIFWWKCGIVNIHMWEVKATHANIAKAVGVSKGTVQRIINKYREDGTDRS